MSASNTETETGSPDQQPECEFDVDDLDISDVLRELLEEWECSRPVWEEASGNRCVWHTSDGQTQEKPPAELEKAVGDGDLHGSAAIGVNLTGIDFPADMGFIDADLSEADLSGADLYDADLSEADLIDANLSGAFLRETNLSEADLYNADLSTADGRYASRADLIDADLSEADLEEADLSRANLEDADLSGADLEDADLSGASLLGADLSGASLSEATLSEADLPRADLSEATLLGADLSEATLLGADLSEADLLGADLSGATLLGADLSGAHLRGADLSGADLYNADLSGANLPEADLRGAELPEASLRGADLSEADLPEASLRGADLSEADLRSADLSATHLAETEFQNSTHSRGTDIDSPGKRIRQPDSGEEQSTDEDKSWVGSGLPPIRRLVELVRNNHENGEEIYDQIARANHELREAYSANGLISRAREARFRERKARRREAVAEEGIRGTVAYLGSVLSMIVTGYGVRLRWVGGSMLLLYLASAVIYWQIGNLPMGKSLYYSVVTFTTSPPANPDLTGPILGVVEGFETFAGTAAIVFLGYVLGTRERV